MHIGAWNFLKIKKEVKEKDNVFKFHGGNLDEVSTLTTFLIIKLWNGG